MDEAGEIWRVERQVLRLVAIVRMLGTGRTARPIELAEAFTTTLHTIRRDRDLLEQAGYSTLESGSEFRNPLRRQRGLLWLDSAAADRRRGTGCLDPCSRALLRQLLGQ